MTYCRPSDKQYRGVTLTKLDWSRFSRNSTQYFLFHDMMLDIDISIDSQKSPKM